MADKLLAPVALAFDYFTGAELLAGLTAGLLSSSSILGRRDEQHEVQNAQGNRWAFERQPRQENRLSRYDEVLSALTTQVTRNPDLPRELQPFQVTEAMDQIQTEEELVKLADEALDAQMPVQIAQVIENQGNAELSPTEVVESPSQIEAVSNLNQYQLYNLISFGRANRRTEYDFDDPASWAPILWQTANDIFTFLGDGEYQLQMDIVQAQQQSTQLSQRGRPIPVVNVNVRQGQRLRNIQDPILARLVLGASVYNQRFFNMTRLQMVETILELINHINNQNILSIGTYIIQDVDIQQINSFRELLEQLQSTYKEEDQSSLVEFQAVPETFIHQPIRSNHFYQTLSLVTFFRDNYRDLVEGSINDAREVHAISEEMSGLELYSAFRSSMITRVTRQFNINRRDQQSESIVAEKALLSPNAQAIQQALDEYEEEEKEQLIKEGLYEEEKEQIPDISRIDDESSVLTEFEKKLRNQLVYVSRGLNTLRNALRTQPRSVNSNYPPVALQKILANSPESDEISNKSEERKFSEERLLDMETIMGVSREYDSAFNKNVSKQQERKNDISQGNFWRNMFNRNKDQQKIEEEEMRLINSSELYRTARDMPDEELKQEEFTEVELENETNPYRSRLARPKPKPQPQPRRGGDDEFQRELRQTLREGTVDGIPITPPRDVEDRSFQENVSSVLLLSLLFGGSGILTSLIINAINNRRRPPPPNKPPTVLPPPVIIPPTAEKEPEQSVEPLPAQQTELIDVIITKPSKIDIRKKRKRKNQEDF